MNKMTVHMTKEALFDFLLFHTYSKFNGFLVNILGSGIAFMGIILYSGGKTTIGGLGVYLAAAILFLSYIPFLLKVRANKQVKENSEYCNPVDYTFSAEGIKVESHDSIENFLWEQIDRAVVTPKTIGIYYGEDKAMILPKEDFGDQFSPIYTTIASQLVRAQ